LISTASRAVFLSYASQDADLAERICEALRATGIEVWFDRSELRGGDVWDQKIRQQIRDCTLFVAVISANTATRGEGYFRLEWALAEQRAQRMARNRSFIVPVCVDSTAEGGADVPEAFTRVQWTRLPAGKMTAQFPARLAALLESAAASAPGPAAHTAEVPAGPAQGGSAPAAEAPALAPITRRRWGVAAGIASLAVVLALAAVFAWPRWRWWPGRVPSTSLAPMAGTVRAAEEKSVAVLPFTDLSEKHDQEYFSDGLAEELIDTLTKFPDLRVPARTSSFSFKGKAATASEIARALGVTHILEGSVRKSGERLRITAQLVRADNGFHVWSQTYNRDTRDIFAVQDDIARAVSEQLRTTLLGTRPPAPQESTSPEAYTLYLQARHLAANDTLLDLDQALALYHRVLELDPRYAPAWVGVAFCLTRRVAQGIPTSPAVHAEVIAAANRAIALNPGIPEAYVALASPYMQYDHNWSAVAAALAKARSLDPNNSQALATYGHLSSATGRPSESVDYFRRAVQGDPLNLVYRKYLGRALHYARRPAESAVELRRAISLDAQFPGLHYELGRALLMAGDAAGASKAFEAEPEGDTGWRRLGLPLGYHASRDSRAQAALADLVAHSQGSEFQVAEAYAFFGDTERAFEWLDKAIMLRDSGVLWSRRDALLASIAADARFVAFLRRLDMPPERDD
jgi:adenylate cyclase